MKKAPAWVLKAILITLLILLTAGGIATYLIVDGLINTRIYQEVDRFSELFSVPSEPFDLAKAVAEKKAFTLEYPEDDVFTILWGTDFHLRRGPFSNRNKVYALLERAFSETNPDLTVISGDLLFSFDGVKMLTEFAAFMEKHNRKWAYSFGNHDGQHKHDKLALGAVLSEFDTALFSNGETWVLGYSDYPVVLMREGKPQTAIMLLDSHDSRVYEGSVIAPDYIYPSQIAWYRWVEDGLGDIPLYAFLHIPIPEFKLLWESGTAIGVKNDRIVNTPRENSGLFAAMQERGNTVAVFSGHDHLNDFHGTWEGIALHYGRSASYGSYGSASHAKGIKTITLNLASSSYTVQTFTVDDWNL